jgi:hypothetical protein
MDSGTEIPGDAPRVHQGRSDPASYFPRRSQTRTGKVRLVSLEQLDGRTAAFKAAQNQIRMLSADLGNDLSVAEQQLVTRAALVGAIASDFEARWVAGEQVPLMDYLAAVNVQRRVLATLGLQRRAKTVGSSFGDILRRDLEHRQLDLTAANQQRGSP